MQRTLTRTGMAGAFAALTVASVLGASLVAHADNIQDNIVDNASSALVLTAGSSTGKTAMIRLVGNNAQQDPDDGCNIDSGDAPLVLDVITPAGITATPDPLSITSCGTDFPVTFTASSTAVGGTATVQIVSGPAGGGTYQNQVSIPLTVTNPNTRPTVTVQGVAAGSYEIGSAPTPTCSVTDAEDGPSTFPAVVTGTLTHGLGTLTATCDYTDKGGLAATTASVTYTIADTGDPTITHTLTPSAPNTNGWFKVPVALAFTCQDTGAGVQSCGPDTTLGNGANQSYTGTAVDWAGNTATDLVTGINVDTVAPGISRVLTPAEPDGNDGWYLHNVGVDFQCEDALSGIDRCDGDTTITDGATGGATGTALDKAGNSASSVLSGLKVDATAPTIDYALLSESSLLRGWFNKPVKVDFTCTDATSGVADCGPDVTLDEGEDQSATGTASDVAGNTATSTASDIDVDTTAPEIDLTLDPATPDGSNGWYVSEVDVAFDCSDALSGLYSCTDDTTIGDGATGAANGTAVDVAGNTASASVSGVKVDTSAPTLGYSLVSAASPVNGWFTKPVTVHFTCDDTFSGVASCPADVELGDGADQTVIRTATDAAGNTTTRTIEDIDVDTTAPTVAFAAGFGATHYYGAVPAAPECVASDAVSGLASCVVTGGGTGVGTHSFTATATDRAGNVSEATLTYEVLAWNVKGFTSPVDMGSVLNTVKGGSTVPLKFEIFTGSTELTSLSAVKKFTTVEINCTTSNFVTDEIEVTSTGGTALRYDTTGGQYIQNWATPKKPGACYKVTMTAQDDSSIAAYFKLK